MSKNQKTTDMAIISPLRRQADEIRALIAAEPDALSYDADDPAMELLHLRLATDPGCDAVDRDGWRGLAVHWQIGVWRAEKEDGGAPIILPSLALLAADGRLCRLSGWPAVNAWCQILTAVKPERIRAGIPIVVRKRQSGSTGRQYWSVSIDDTAIDPSEISPAK